MGTRFGASSGQGAAEAFRRRRRSGQGPERTMAAQEGPEDADRRSIGLGQFCRLAHQSAVESQRFDATRFERVSTRASSAFARLRIGGSRGRGQRLPWRQARGSSLQDRL